MVDFMESFPFGHAGGGGGGGLFCRGFVKLTFNDQSINFSTAVNPQQQQQQFLDNIEKKY